MVASAEEKQSSSGLEFKLHPLVLINISDHFTRLKANAPPTGAGGEASTSGAAAAAGAGPSAAAGAGSGGGAGPVVMGCLLGSQDGRAVDIANSFEIKYARSADGRAEVDGAFLLKKQEQYKTVFPKQDVVGWYCTGAAVEEQHMAVHRKIMELNESPVFLLLDPAPPPVRKDLPVEVYETELHVLDGAPTTIFVRALYSMETSDAERIAVDQVAKILPGGRASGSEQLNAHLASLHSAVKMLADKLAVVKQRLDDAASGAAPPDRALLRRVNALVSGLPALDNPGFRKEYLTEYNDTLGVLLLAGVTQSLSGLSELADRFGVAYERAAARRGARGGGGGGSFMTASLYNA